MIHHHTLSQFLPQSFDPTKPLALIAGKGLYPDLLLQRLKAANIPVRLIAFVDETAQSLIDQFPEKHRSLIKVGQLGAFLKALKKFEAAYAIMAGQITPKRLFKGLHPDLKALTILATLKQRNAETIFGAITKEAEAIGVIQLDARAFLDDQLADLGPMTSGKIKLDQAWIDHGIHIAKEIARLDIGQGVVVRKGTVIAAEAFEGTDNMLRRAGEFKTDNALFIKTSKPNQDYRFDVPVFGLKTLEVMHESGLTFAGLEANQTIILDKAQVLQKSNKLGIKLFGF